MFLFLLISFQSFAQIKGTITDDLGTPLSNVTIVEENTYKGTSSNDAGKYELNANKTGQYIILYQHLGYKTQKVTITVDRFPYTQNIKLIEENFALAELVLNAKKNPADAVIRNAISSKNENSKKTARFKADFYSRGIFKVKDLPKKILGQKVGDLDGAVDSTGTGIIYLSETVSKIIFEKPDNLKERIIASKVSGDNKGFSFNTAISTMYDFYDNTINFNQKLISPIATNAFNYYKYKLEGTFQDENNYMINKIKVIAKRDAEPVFDGYIYIVEDSWAIYAVDLTIKGYRMKREVIDVLNLQQNFNYNKNQKIWAKNSQSLDFTAGLFGIKFTGKFSYIYSNYEFEKSFAKKTFTNEIVSFEDNSNKKDTLFWNKNRPIPLTVEEKIDYIKKDSISQVRNSAIYLDSIDKKENKFTFLSPIRGFTWKNSVEKKTFVYKGLFDLSSVSFNTVQGWNIGSGFSYQNLKNEEKSGKTTTISTKFNYGFSDNRLRVTADYSYRFNNRNYATLNIFGGSKVNQFNPEEPIKESANTITTLFYESNFMKLYNKEFVGAAYGQNVGSNLYIRGTLEYQQRKALFNSTDYTIRTTERIYTSNNPQFPEDYLNAGFAQHHLTKASIFGKISFGNKYISRPNGKINIRNQNYPIVYFGYEKAFASTDKKFEYHLFTTQLRYDLKMANKGTLGMNLQVGTFVNGDAINFIDYKHFNGNNTRIGRTERYLNVFNIMPYYTNSTNKSYFESHFEHDDTGYIMNKIPLLNKLNTTLIVGFHALVAADKKPYSEYTIGLNNLGFGKLKLFRFDYVRSSQNGFQNSSFIFGLKILNIVD